MAIYLLKDKLYRKFFNFTCCSIQVIFYEFDLLESLKFDFYLNQVLLSVYPLGAPFSLMSLDGLHL